MTICRSSSCSVHRDRVVAYAATLQTKEGADMPSNIVSAQQTRVAPWIGIGASGHWKSSAEALEAAQLDFTVRQEQLYWQHDDNGIIFDEPVSMFGNVRNTDDRLLGCVTDQYKIIQNAEAFSLLDPFLTNGAITHAGMTEDGLAFMVAEVGLQTIGGEDYMMHLMATNSFNTKYPCQIIMTPLRIICQNMYRKIVNDRIFLAKHTTTADERLKAIASGNIVEKKVLAFSEIIEHAQSVSIDSKKLAMLIALLFPYPKEGGPREATFKLKADESRKAFVDRYFDAPDNRRHQDSAFGFINAYMDYLSHRPAAREMSMPWADRRLSGIISGLDVNSSVIKEALK